MDIWEWFSCLGYTYDVYSSFFKSVNSWNECLCVCVVELKMLVKLKIK